MKIRDLVAKLFPHNNKRCVAPPGMIRRSEGSPIIVSSLMRSGTHLLIDLLLNNFPEYRRSPLYIDIDRYLTSELPVDDVFACGRYVIKSHFPQFSTSPKSGEILSRIAKTGCVLRPERDLKDVYRSLKDFSYAGSYDDLLREKEESEAFWGRFNVLRVSFQDLSDPGKTPELVSRISAFSGIRHPDRVVCNFMRHETGKVMVSKLATRILGKRSPYINTTIRFASTVID